MAIQPIDLQTMYQQQSNVSKILSANQQVQLTEQMQQQNNIQKNLEKSKTVQQTNTDKQEATKTNEDGSNSASYNFTGEQKKDAQTKTVSSKNVDNLKSYIPPNLGNLIDISR